MEHTWYKCADGYCGKVSCDFCGSLPFCTVCSGIEGSLTSECCGARMSKEQEDLVFAGELDYKDGKWVRCGTAGQPLSCTE